MSRRYAALTCARNAPSTAAWLTEVGWPGTSKPRGHLAGARKRQETMHRFIIVLVGLAVGSCAIDTPFDPGPQPRNYRQIIADKLPTLGVEPRSAEISQTITPAVGAQPGNWVTCLKGFALGKIRFRLVSFTPNEKRDESGSTIFDLDSRWSVGTDRCEEAVYGPLPPATPKPAEKSQKQKPGKNSSSK
jgi:hypothetical protein